MRTWDLWADSNRSGSGLHPMEGWLLGTGRVGAGPAAAGLEQGVAAGPLPLLSLPLPFFTLAITNWSTAHSHTA